MLPKERKYFVTGNTVFETRIPCLVLIPRSQDNWVYFTFFGALEYMSRVASWFTGGETTPEEAAAIFDTVYNEARAMLFIIGMISDFAAPLPDDSGWIQCDGSVYAETALPDLFAAIGTTYNTGGEGSGNFRVPDLRGRVRATINSGETRLPSWADDPGGTGGESEHTLTVSELAAHTHTDSGHTHVEGNTTPTAITIGPGAPAPAAIGAVGVTGSGSAAISTDGGDTAHNNVQPTMTLYTYILAFF